MTKTSCLLPLVAVIFFTVMGGQGLVWADGEVPEKSVPALPEGSKHKAGEKTESDALTRCPEPRPQICTREFRPVCAKLQDGSYKTYSTGCTSCTDPKVVGYRDGACE